MGEGAVSLNMFMFAQNIFQLSRDTCFGPCHDSRVKNRYDLSKGLSLHGRAIEDDKSGMRALFESVYKERPQAICQNFSIFEK